MCLISFKYDAKVKAWDILLVLTSVAGNLCNKCPSGYSNKTAVKVILSMQSLVSIEQQSPRRPCDITHKTFPTKARKGIGMVVWVQFNRFAHSKIDKDQVGHAQVGHLSLGLAQPLFEISQNLFTVMF